MRKLRIAVLFLTSMAMLLTGWSAPWFLVAFLGAIALNLPAPRTREFVVVAAVALLWFVAPYARERLLNDPQLHWTNGKPADVTIVSLQIDAGERVTTVFRENDKEGREYRDPQPLWLTLFLLEPVTLLLGLLALVALLVVRLDHLRPLSFDKLEQYLRDTPNS